MKNLGLKLVSLMLAVVLWFFVSAPRREPVRERLFTAPVSFVSMPSNFVITTEIPASVAVRVRGRAADLRSLSAQNLEVTVDLQWIRNAGDAEITLRPQAINLPPELEVVSITPNKIPFRVEELRQRTVPIRPFLAGEPPEGFIIGEMSTEPAVALVSGPAPQLMNLREVTTERIIIAGSTGTFVRNAVVVSDSPLVRVISPLTTQVTVPVLAEVGPNQPPPATAAGTTTTERKSP